MLWLALCALSLGLLGLLAYRLPVSLGSNLQVRAEPSGNWVLALGVGLGPFAFSALAAHGVAPFLTCHVFGKQLVRLPLSRWLDRPAKKAEPHAKAAAPSRFERTIARFFQSLDPLETLLSLLSGWERGYILRVEALELDVEYSFRDV